MNRDLFLSILALDSYNRSYGQRINITGDTSKLGEAAIYMDSAVLLDATTRKDIKADFYAIAYDYNGERIISIAAPMNSARTRATAMA